jgi:hypothetical protein
MGRFPVAVHVVRISRCQLAAQVADILEGYFPYILKKKYPEMKISKFKEPKNYHITAFFMNHDEKKTESIYYKEFKKDKRMLY